jgi:hypothetical protein
MQEKKYPKKITQKITNALEKTMLYIGKWKRRSCTF